MGEFRWSQPSGGQASLFEPARRVVGRGEYRGLTFHEVEAKSVINPAPPGTPWFNFTINAYRGCSHACSYCLAGDTPILMANGRTKPISELTPGDRVYGTKADGSYRRFVEAEVLDQWRSVKLAYRIQCADGTTLIASGDHRFLTDRGWKYVTGSEQGSGRRPHLTTNNRFAGPGQFASSPKKDEDGSVTTRLRSFLGTAVKLPASLAITHIESLGIEMPMFDLTTTTGDFIAHGVVSHNCFARPTHEYLGFNMGSDFDSQIVVKVNAVDLVRAETTPSRWSGDAIAMGTNTDPYQAAEGKYRLTKGIIEVLTERNNPFSILTKSPLVLRDIDLIVGASERAEVRVDFSIPTLDEDVWRRTEPGTAHPRKRMDAVARFNHAGVRSSVMMAPLIPGISDRPEQIAAVRQAAAEAGAESCHQVKLHLRGVRGHFLDWLQTDSPQLRPTYERLYPERRKRSTATRTERDSSQLALDL